MKKKKKKSSNSNFLSINLHELDVEWAGQPNLYYKWAKKLAKARLVQDEAKAALELTVADLDSEIRSKPKKHGLTGEKITEAAIKNAILAAEEYTDAVDTVNKARYEVNVLEAGVTSLEHRKKALEKEVDLFAMDYFSVPRVSGGNGREAKQKFDKKAARGRYRREEP